MNGGLLIVQNSSSEWLLGTSHLSFDVWGGPVLMQPLFISIYPSASFQQWFQQDGLPSTHQMTP